MARGPAARHDSCRAPLARENDASLGESEREETRAFARLESPSRSARARVVEWRARVGGRARSTLERVSMLSTHLCLYNTHQNT